jgi:hypothetical protein
MKMFKKEKKDPDEELLSALTSKFIRLENQYAPCKIIYFNVTKRFWHYNYRTRNTKGKRKRRKDTL